MFPLEQRGISVKTWIVLEEVEGCQDHRILSWKIWGPDPVAGESGYSTTSAELWFVSAEDAAPVELCWDPVKCCWVKACLSKHSRWCLKPSNLFNTVFCSPPPVLCSLALQSKWHLVSTVAFDFSVALLKANNFHAGLMEELLWMCRTVQSWRERVKQKSDHRL